MTLKLDVKELQIELAKLSAEVKNTVYPAFKKWLPPSWIKKDITFRNLAMIIRDPNDGKVFCDEERQ